MPLTLSPGGASDGPAIAHVYVSAFFNDPVHVAAFADLSYEVQHTWFTEAYPLFYNHPQLDLHKVTDTETGELVAMSRWAIENAPVELIRRLKPDAMVPDGGELPPLPVVDLPEGHNKEFGERFQACIKASKSRFLGDRPLLHLKLLATSPSHHRRGAGAMMLKWMCDFADAEGVYCWLEGTEMGRPLYERHGFVTVEEIRSKWDGGEATFYCMARAPNGSPLELDAPAPVTSEMDCT